MTPGGRRPGRRAADQLRWRQDPLDDRAVPPGGRLRTKPTPRGRGNVGRCGHRGAAASGHRRAGRPDDRARPGHYQARRHRGPHPLGRAGLAARPGRRLRAGRRRRPLRHQPRGGPGRPAPPPCPVPGPDRRVGGLRPPALRRGRPAGRVVRRPVHLRPDAGRGNPGGRGGAPSGLDSRLRHRGRRRGRTRLPGAAEERDRPGGVVLATRLGRGGL
jgi:hypothetical protein